MDYSLLLGLDAAKKELVVGLVDAIGSFNLFKTIESRGKLALTRGGEVTVVSTTSSPSRISLKHDDQIPPDQYRERFETALKHYFLVSQDDCLGYSTADGSRSALTSGQRLLVEGMPRLTRYPQCSDYHALTHQLSNGKDIHCLY